MVKKADQEVINKRLEDTADLFKPTAQQAAAAEAAEAERAPVKSRRYEADHPAYSFRIKPEDNERLDTWAELLGMTRDEVGRGLIGAALEALDLGRLTLGAEHETTIGRDSRGRRRRYGKTVVSWKWESSGAAEIPQRTTRGTKAE